LFTPGVRSDFRDQATQDFGKHEILYAIYGHKGDSNEGNSNWEAARLNQSLIPFQVKQHDGFMGKSFSFLNINSDNISISAIKKAENNDELIIRLQETKGKAVEEVYLMTPVPIITAHKVNGQEEYLSEALVKDGKLIFNIKPYQLIAFALKLAEPSSKLNLPICLPISLHYDLNVMSYEKIKSFEGFDDIGSSFPAELIPDMITSEGIIFKIGPKKVDKKNALICKGQSIMIPEGNFNRLYILAASIEDDSKGIFKVDGVPHEIAIQKWSGFIGSWDNRLWDGQIEQNKPDFYWGNIDYIGISPGYIKRDNVAYFTTHRHLKNGENDLYSYGYLFKYKIEIIPGSKKITLPVNENIRILAITAAHNVNDESKPARFLYDVINRDLTQYNRFQVCAKPKIFTESYIIDQERSILCILKSKEARGEIRYTLDDSDPTTNSLECIEPIIIDEPLTIKAATFKQGKQRSQIIRACFYKAYHIKGIKYLTQHSPKYPGNGEKTLIDSFRAGPSYLDKAWQGFEENDLEVILDLGEIRSMHRITIGCLNNNSSWIFLPTSIEVSVSENNNNFTKVAENHYDIPKGDEGLFIKDLSVIFDEVKAKYLLIKAKNIGTCPDWHPGAGGKAWLFVDEIFVE
jgi:alpha-mannosidase